MNAMTGVITFLVSFVLVFQPAIQVVLEQEARNDFFAAALKPLAPAEAEAQTPPISLDSPLKLARTQSAYAVDGVAGGEITISYHAVNTGLLTVEDPLLVTTLAPGATLLEAIPEAEVGGQTLAFVLPSVRPGEMETATLRVALPAGSGPISVDEGALLSGSLVTSEVSDALDATVLPASLGVDPTLLDPTPDARVEDFETLRAIGLVGCDAGDIYDFVRDEVDYEAYRGSLRGSRGTLWSMAGNALDQASLLIAMLRACGYAARYATGTLPDGRAQQLIGSMFPPVLGAVGGVDPETFPEVDGFEGDVMLLEFGRNAPGADVISDPENDPELLETARRHAWVEAFIGGAFVSLDPTFADANEGDTFTSLSQSFAEVPDSMRHRIEFSLVEEEYPIDVFNNILAAAYLIDPSDELVRNGIKPVGDKYVQEVEVLNQTLRTVDLVGEIVRFGHFVDHSTTVSTTAFTFNTYSPWMQVGSDPELIRGTDYQEAFASLGIDMAKLVTGLFVRMTTIDPDGNEELFEHTYIDRFGLAQRVGEEPVGAPDLSGEPILSEYNSISISVPVSDTPEHVLESAVLRGGDRVIAFNEEFPTAATDDLTTYSAEQLRALTQGQREVHDGINEIHLKTISRSWELGMIRGEGMLGAIRYLSEPQLFVSSFSTMGPDGPGSFVHSTDLRKFDFQAVPRPGEPMSAAFATRMASGQFLTVLEAASFLELAVPATRRLGSLAAFNAAEDQGIPVTAIGAGNLVAVDELDVSPESRARIRAALSSGKSVITPSEMVIVDGVATLGWFEIDEATGDTIGVGENGGHLSSAEYILIRDSALTSLAARYQALGMVGTILFFVVDLYLAAGACQNIWCKLHKSLKIFMAFVGSIACGIILGAIVSAGLGLAFFGPPAWLLAGFMGFLCMFVLGFFSDWLNQQYNDPPLSNQLVRFPGLPPRRESYAEMSSAAAFPGGSGTVSGSCEADHLRLAGDLDLAPDPGSAAFYPTPLAGIGAGGTVAEDLNFEASSLVTLTAGQANLDVAAGTLAITGDTLAGPENVGFSGFDGAVAATDSGATDAVDIDGTYDRVLVVDLNQNNAPGSHDASASFQVALRSNAADDYFLTARAPEGWDTDLSGSGLATFTPPFGEIPGDYEVQIVAQSLTDERLIAEARPMVSVGATVAAGLQTVFVEDVIFNVPQHGTTVFSNYILEITNQGLVEDVFDVSIAGLADSDFTQAVPFVTIPAGATGRVGVAFHPVSGMPSAGSSVSFSGTATGRSTGLSSTASASFAYPTVFGVLPRFAPREVLGVPGDSFAVDLELEGSGNGSSTFSIDVVNDYDLAVGGIPGSATVTPGATSVVPVSLTIPPGTPPGSLASVSVVADLCNGVGPESCAIPLPHERTAMLSVMVTAPEALCLGDAALRSLDGPILLSRDLNAFSAALSVLTTDPTDLALQSRALSTGNTLVLSLVGAGLDGSAGLLSDLLAELASGDTARINTMLADLCTTLAALPGEVEAAGNQSTYGFTLGLAPASAVVSPGDSAEYTLRLESTGSEPTTIDLALSGLPASVTGGLSQSQVTLAPGEVLDENSASPIVATLSSPTAITGASFGVDATATASPGVMVSTNGLFSAVEAAIDVVGVTPNPTAVEAAGDPLDVSVELLSRVNQARDVLVTWRVEDPSGALLFTGSPVAARVGNGGGTTTVPLGTVPTTGFPDGNHNVIALVTTPEGDSIPGREGRGVFFVGLPFSAYVDASPSLVPPGSSEAVTSSVIVAPESVTQVGLFADQFADAVASETDVTDATNALGPPETDVAVLPLGAVLVVDMGLDGERIGDGVGDDLVVFERDPGVCNGVHDSEYEVAVSNDPAGPFTVLGTASGDRPLGDGFDLAGSGLSFARYVRITSLEDELGIDAVLAAHTVSPNHIQLEYHLPGGVETGVASTPMIGDVDEDGNPEVFFTIQTGADQCEAIGIDGVTHAEDFRVTYPTGCSGGIGSCFCGNSSSAALGDIDVDGTPEVLLYQTTTFGSGVMTGYENDGTEILNFTPTRNAISLSPVLDNVDADPEPEIVWPGGYMDLDGTIGLNLPVGQHPVAVDLDDDDEMELVMEVKWGVLRAFETDGTILWSAVLSGLTSNFSRPAVADLNDDGTPDLIVVHTLSGGRDRAVAAVNGLDGSILWETAVDDAIGVCSNNGALCGGPHPACSGLFATCDTNEANGAGATPTVADLDGDGEPEVATFIRRFSGLEDHVVAFEADGTFKWSTATRDPSGAPPEISSADLNGDGSAEVLWNGSCDGFTVLDGTNGTLLYRDPRASSASGGDNPTAGDIDNDGHMEVATGGFNGLYIFGADLDWGPGRSVWNHIDYHVTNVNDDLTIPTAKAPHWTAENTYRSQTAGSLAGGTASVVITHDLGGDFSFDPADITPAPSQVNGIVEWDETLSSLTSFDVPGTVPPLQPGESVVVSDGTTVVGTLQLDGGGVVNLSIPLGETTVAAPHILGLTPETQTTPAGDTADFTVHVENLRASSETFTLDVAGVDPSDVTIAPSVTVPAGDTADVPLSISTSLADPLGRFDFLVMATGDLGTEDHVFGSIEVTQGGGLPRSTGGVIVELAPGTVVAGPGGSARVDVIVTNTGRDAETFDLSVDIPGSITSEFADPSLTVSPGVGASRTTYLVFDLPAGTSSGPIGYDVTATAQSDPDLDDTTSGVLDVTAHGVDVELTPDATSLPPGGSTTVSAIVTNTGREVVTATLEIVGLFEPWACFSSPCTQTQSVPLAPGESATVPVHLSGLPNLSQQTSLLAVQATAAPFLGGAPVTDLDYSLVTVDGARGLGLAVSPGTITEDSLAPIPFTLEISNTGNLCDEQYTMTFDSDPAGVTVLPESTTFAVPSGRTALVGAYAMAPAFGTYTLHVHVETDTSNSLCPGAPASSADADLTLILNGTNVGPVANAGPDATANVGEVVDLDGTQSFDPDGGALTYAWTFQSVPAGSSLTSADIADATTAEPSFTPDAPGAFILALDVSDGQLNDGDTVTITVGSAVGPVADAGLDQEVVTGEPAQADGTGSYDPDGDLITFAWTVLSTPGGSGVSDASLSNPADAKPVFTPDVDGEYLLEVVVSDGQQTDSDTVILTAAPLNLPPIADAGPNLGTRVGRQVSLDGRDSVDPDDGPGALTFLWALLETPAGSTATDADIVDRADATAKFTPDVPGRFVLGLAVSDGDRTSSDVIEIQTGTSNIPPIADAGDDMPTTLGGIPTLDGRESEDQDNSPDPLTFSWRFVAVPAGSSLTDTDLRDADTDAPSFTPDAVGTFVLRLTVTDGQDSHSDNTAVEVERRPGLQPTADVFLRRGSRAVNEGASPYLVIRGKQTRILVKFDLAEIQAELGGQELGSAYLEMEINGPTAQGWKKGTPLGAYRMTEPWVEGNGYHYRVRPLRDRTRGTGAGATWWCGTDDAIENGDKDCNGTDWTLKPPPKNNPNGLANPWIEPATATTTIDNRQTGTLSFDVTADVLAWLGGTPNRGWAILKEPKTGGGTLWLDSKEGPSPPRLVIVPR